MSNDIREFFEGRILPLHHTAIAEKKMYLNTAFRSADASYFSSPQRPDCLYLNNIPMTNETELPGLLNGFFGKTNQNCLEAIPDFAKLVFQLKEENREQSAELSPFVYAMF